jgi:hypothetical protein
MARTGTTGALVEGLGVAERITRATGDELIAADTLAEAERATTVAAERWAATGATDAGVDVADRPDQAAATRAEKSCELDGAGAAGLTAREELS